MEEFPKGSSLTTITNVDGGKAFTTYWCFICDAFTQTMDPYDIEEGFEFGAFACETEYLKFKQSYNHGIQSQRQMP